MVFHGGPNVHGWHGWHGVCALLGGRTECDLIIFAFGGHVGPGCPDILISP